MSDHRRRNYIALSTAGFSFLIYLLAGGSFFFFAAVFLSGYVAGFARYPIVDQKHCVGDDIDGSK